MKQSGYAEHCHLRAEAPPAGSRQELVWPVGPPPQQVSAPNLWGTATGTVSCPRSIQCALPPLAPPRTRSPSVSEVSAPWTWRFKESSGTSMYPPPSPGAVGSTLPEDDAEASEPATKGPSSNGGLGPHRHPEAQSLASHADPTHAHADHTDARRYTDRTHMHTRHIDTCQTQITHMYTRDIQMLASNKHLTHACVSYRCSPATKITHARARETDACQAHGSHTHAKCHTDMCKTYRRSPATNISHTRVSYRCSPTTKITHAR